MRSIFNIYDNYRVLFVVISLKKILRINLILPNYSCTFALQKLI